MKTLKLILYFVISVILTAVVPFSGILMPFVLIMSTALMLAMSVKWNLIFAAFSAAFAGLAIYFLSFSTTGLISAIVFPVLAFIPVVGILITLKKKLTVKASLLAGTSGLFALIAVIYLIYGGNFVADIINTTKSLMIDTLDSVLISLPTESVVAAEEMKQFYNAYFENLKVIAPAIILSFIFLISYFSIKFANLFAKNHSDFSEIPPFSEIRSPAFFILIVIISYFGQFIENPFASGLSANIFMILTVYLTLCGYSFLDFLLKRRIKNIFARVLISLAITIIMTFLSLFLYFINPVLIAMFIGLADSLFNYRAKIQLIKGK